MGCTSSKAHAEIYDEYGRLQSTHLSPKAEEKRRRRMVKEAARAEKLRQRLPSPVVQGDDLPPWIARQREVYTPTRPTDGYHSYGAVDDDSRHQQQYSYSEKQSSLYR